MEERNSTKRRRCGLGGSSPAGGEGIVRLAPAGDNSAVPGGHFRISLGRVLDAAAGAGGRPAEDPELRQNLMSTTDVQPARAGVVTWWA